jgi:hypothetical protein
MNAQLIKIGKLPASATEPVSLSQDEPTIWWARSNTRALARRAEKEFGWRPRRPSFATVFAAEVETYVKPM